MIVVGIDENGLGPRLGPLVATALTVEVGDYDPARLAKAGLKLGLTDSKQVGGFGKMAFIESIALALVDRLSTTSITGFDHFLNEIGLDSPETLQTLCPSKRVATQCWSMPLPLPLPAFGGDAKMGHGVLDKLEDKLGVRSTRIRTSLSCAKALNNALDDGRSKLKVDLELFERLMLDARQASGKNLRAYCGMVGGIRKYDVHFQVFEPKNVTTLESTKGVHAYRVKGLGEVRFEVSADRSHLPVAIASMVGKYVRELSMHRLNSFYATHKTGLRSASGYHDPVTKAFVAATEGTRSRLRIPTSCFERRA